MVAEIDVIASLIKRLVPSLANFLKRSIVCCSSQSQSQNQLAVSATCRWVDCTRQSFVYGDVLLYAVHTAEDLQFYQTRHPE